MLNKEATEHYITEKVHLYVQVAIQHCTYITKTNANTAQEGTPSVQAAIQHCTYITKTNANTAREGTPSVQAAIQHCKC